ncbi:thiamine pyrophosphokinase [Clostridiales Family XIII bacterium PM5-7]
MTKALIITSHVEGVSNLYMIQQESYSCVICADGGLLIAQQMGIKPDLLIGDYDSTELPESADVIHLPMEKNMTDSEAAIDLAVSKGYRTIDILGGLGGRFDHTMGNIGMLAKYCDTLSHMALIDGQNYVFMMNPGTISIPKNRYKYMGVISYGTSVPDVTLEGVKYPLSRHFLTNTTTLGVSNEIIADAATVSFSTGKLLIILSNDIDKP